MVSAGGSDERPNRPEAGHRERAGERFLETIEKSGAVPAGMSPEQAASAVFCALALRVTRAQQADLLSTLPGPLLDRLDACVMHETREAAGAFERDDFLRLIGEHLGNRSADSEAVARAVFGALRGVLDSEARHHMESQLPSAIKDMWHGDDTPRGSAGPGPDLSPSH